MSTSPPAEGDSDQPPDLCQRSNAWRISEALPLQEREDLGSTAFSAGAESADTGLKPSTYPLSDLDTLRVYWAI